MAKLDEILKLTKQHDASDLHLASGSAPYLRVNGEMVKLNYRDVAPEVCRGLIFEILNEKQWEEFEEESELDFSYAVAGIGRFRVNVFNQRNGIGAVFRLVPERVPTLEDLGLPGPLRELIDASEGLIVVTGPTGSGKSTTMAALVNEINLSRRAHIITIEDPIEFIHQNKQSLINQREVGSHTGSFENALRAALREDPDIILVGEMRDLQTISLALTAAETGHLVLATLHTNSAIKTVDRIIDVFPEGQQSQIRVMLSESLRGVVAQTLLPLADNRGRVAAVEVLVNVPAVSNLIREAKTYQIPSVMQTSRAQGMMTFETSVGDLIQRKLITQEDGAAFLRRRGSVAAGSIYGTGTASNRSRNLAAS